MTPTQELIFSVLTARHRTGETLWVFSNATRKAADGLVQQGIISVLSGNVPRTYRARLTDTGLELMRQQADSYVSPIEEQLKMVRMQLAELQELRRLEARYDR